MSKLSAVSVSKFHHKMYVILAEYSMDAPIYELLCKTNIEYITCVTENFTHLDKTIDNICSYNVTNSKFNFLFLNVKSLERLLNYEGTIGWLDGVMFTLFAKVLNFSLEYDTEKKKRVMFYLLSCLLICKIMC